MFETLERLNLYAVLGLGRDAPTAAIEEAHRRLVDKFHPTKNAWLTDEAERSKLVFVFAKIKAAYQTLREGKSRIEYDEQLRRLDKETAGESYMRMEFAKTDRQRALEERIKESEALFKEGRRLFEAHRLHDAHEKVAKAIEIYPEEARFFALAGKIGALNPNIRWQKEAEGHLRRAIEIDPWNADYRVALGLLYKNAGLRHKAKKEFVRALELDAANETALAEVPAAERPAKKELPSQPTLPGDDEVDWS
jgi:tetratricopeptide (TPR) repeat protein